MRIALVLAGLVATLVGCTTSEPVEISPPVDPAPVVPEWQVAPSGVYPITSTFALDPAAFVADRAALTGALRAYAAHPGAELIALADAAHDPALAVLRADLSAADQQALAGWIDAAVSPQGVLIVLGLEYGVRGSMKNIAVHGELVFDASGARDHLTELEIAAYQRRFPLGGEPGEIVDAPMTSTTQGGGLELGAHDLAFGIGAYAWDAVDAQAAQTGGMRGTLGAATQCALVALAVAQHVAHVTEIDQLCERGLDRLVARGRAEASALAFTTLHVVRGNVGMEDANRDHVADGLFGGTWELEATAGTATVTLTAAFR